MKRAFGPNLPSAYIPGVERKRKLSEDSEKKCRKKQRHTKLKSTNKKTSERKEVFKNNWEHRSQAGLQEKSNRKI